MIAMHALLLLALLGAASAGEPLRSGCMTDDQQIGSVGPSDHIQVESALAGESSTCYKISVVRGDTSLSGYVLGESLPAIDLFVRRREKVSQESAIAEARLAREAARAKTQANEPGKAVDPLVSTQFEDFAGRDVNGKPVSLSGLNGRVTVVTFWSPGSPGSISELTHALPLYKEFHKSGLAAVGVSMDPKAGRISESLDDIMLPWPQMADQSGLAARYHVDPRAGKTFVLDASHRIVAAGPMGPDIVKAVHQLLDAPASQ
jgi:peroxiredoxin